MGQSDSPEIAADFYIDVDASGYGTLWMENVDYGLLSGFQVNGIRFCVDVTVVPEPATVMLFALGAVMMKRKRT